MFLFPLLSHSQSSNYGPLQFQLGDEIKVFSAKAYRRNQGKVFETVGNTVIVHKKETLYGHSSRIDMETGDFEITGNLRYIDPLVTLYGSHADYNLKTQKMKIDNARLVSRSYTLVAKEIRRVNKTDYIAKEAEFTTCRDCPESWSVYGQDVKLTVDEYIYVTHALVRMRGASLLYFPYMVFPIKKERQTGLLFPSVGNRFGEGFVFQLPWFWAIGPSSDMTLSPTFWAERGWGSDYEVRKAINQYSYINLSGRAINDRVYRPDKLMDDRDREADPVYRDLHDWEARYANSWNTSLHMHGLDVKDTDVFRDYPEFGNQRLNETEFGLSATLTHRRDWGTFSLEAHQKKSVLSDEGDSFSDVTDFNDNTVNMLPRLRFESMPLVMWKHDGNFFPRFDIRLATEGTVFKQNNNQEALETAFRQDLARPEDAVLRNASRLDFTPEAGLEIYNNGIVDFRSDWEWNYQHYSFRDENESDFAKSAQLMKTSAGIGFEKVFGVAYQELPTTVDEEHDFSSETGALVRSLPELDTKKEKQKAYSYSSYKHAQEIRLIHHGILGETESGNQKFRNQIDDIRGWFDYKDSIVSRRFRELADPQGNRRPLEDTLEVFWNHELVRKEAKRVRLRPEKPLHTNFRYRPIGSMNISYYRSLNTYKRLQENQHLNYLDFGSSFSPHPIISLSLADYYWIDGGVHNTTLAMGNNLGKIQLNNALNRNTATDARIWNSAIQASLTDQLVVNFNTTRNLNTRETIRSESRILYLPKNNCWAIGFSFVRQNDETLSNFRFAVNFGQENFASQIWQQ